MYFAAYFYGSPFVEWVPVQLESWGSVFEKVRFLLSVFLVSSLASLCSFSFAFASSCEIFFADDNLVVELAYWRRFTLGISLTRHATPLRWDSFRPSHKMRRRSWFLL